MDKYVRNLKETDRTMLADAGGKAAGLGELSCIPGISVPGGFFLTTRAYRDLVRDNAALDTLLDELASCPARDPEVIRKLSVTIRTCIENIPVPPEISAAVSLALKQFPGSDGFAVRSSATAEDLPSASFAGQQDSFLNIQGEQEVLRHIRKCWASLFTERAVTYRIRNGFDHRTVSLAVIVQQMIFPDAAGTLFTADPVTSNRKVVSIDAAFGLGEAVVSGLVNPDNYRVIGGRISEKSVSRKLKGIYPVPGGGTVQKDIEPSRQNEPVLTDARIHALELQGRTIESHFGAPQDIEWCLAGDTVYMVQSRPVTTLFPVPEADDSGNHVYLSVGHNQMMTDAMKPLGLSFFLLTTRAPMRQAGGRPFIDVSAQLRSLTGRTALLNTIGKSDPLIKDALLRIFEREFVPLEPHTENAPISGIAGNPGDAAPAEPDPGAALVAEMIRLNEESVSRLKENIRDVSGPDLFDFIRQDIGELQKVLFTPENLRVIMAAISASAWINEKMLEYLGEKNAADTISQSVEHNVTSAMGLELLDLADAIRPYPEVVTYLRQCDDDFLAHLPELEGGQAVRHAIEAYLNRYGMRCPGEIDITRPRWSEKPARLIPVLLSHIQNFAPGEAARRFGQGLSEAMKKEEELLGRLAELPDGDRKASETKKKIDLVRNLVGYREYPKYSMVSRYWVYKKALLKEAEKLVRAGVVREIEDTFHLTFGEFREMVRTGRSLEHLIRERKEEFRVFENLVPPRVITSDGEIITGRYSRDGIPAGALAGLPVSSGIIEGRARVMLRMEDGDIREGDILVTTYTDPSWTPLFVSIKGLVTEVGGLTTHGAVIAREYGLPAIVGVENATRILRDGQRIRVNGTDGYLQILEE